jgi:hypothetical protein
MMPRILALFAFLVLAATPLLAADIPFGTSTPAIVAWSDVAPPAPAPVVCCDNQCPGDEPGRHCPPQCTYCSCSPEMGHVVTADAGVSGHHHNVCVAMPRIEPQRTATTPLNIFRPPRILSV